MFRFAYSGYAPHSGFGRSTRGTRAELWKGAHACFSWHGGPILGVRRPIRHLAYKLDLDEDQVRELAGILDRLKTARAQADVDGRRTASGIAGVLESGDFDRAAARDALDTRARSEEALRAETLEVLERLHRLLDPDQRRELAYLVRSGSVAF